jgi:hypothetical protein
VFKIIFVSPRLSLIANARPVGNPPVSSMKVVSRHDHATGPDRAAGGKEMLADPALLFFGQPQSTHEQSK